MKRNHTHLKKFVRYKIIRTFIIAFTIGMILGMLSSCTTYKIVHERTNERRIAPEFFIDSKGRVLIYVPEEGRFWDKKQFKDK